jgi:hypothetical protein
LSSRHLPTALAKDLKNDDARRAIVTTRRQRDRPKQKEILKYAFRQGALAVVDVLKNSMSVDFYGMQRWRPWRGLQLMQLMRRLARAECMIFIWIQYRLNLWRLDDQ